MTSSREHSFQKWIDLAIKKLFLRTKKEKEIPLDDFFVSILARQAFFCVECETVFDMKYHQCPSCMSNQFLPLKRVVK